MGNSKKIKNLRNILTLGWLLFFRDFQYRYRLTFLGYFWAFIRPLLIGIPFIIVGHQFNLGGESMQVPYVAYALSGIVFIQLFWDNVIFPQWVTRRVRQVIKAVSFPYEALVVAGCFYSLFNAAIYAVLIAAIFIIYNISISSTMLLAILSVPFVMLAGLSIGIYTVPVTLIYLDIRYGFPLLFPVIIWSVPILYKSPESGLLHTINKWNPLTYLIITPVNWLVGMPAESVGLFILTLVIFTGLLLLGLRFMNSKMPLAIDQIP